MTASRRPTARPESGFTLIELLVTMTVMVIIMSIVFLSINDWVTNSEKRVTNGGQASAAIEEAFMTLDGEVRYAADISTPAESLTTYPGFYWVEFQSDWTIASQASAQCTQLEYNTAAGTLQQRTWLANAIPPISGANPPTTGWRVLASGLSTAPAGSGLASGDPFSLSQTSPNLLNPSTPTTTTTTTLPGSPTTTTEVATTPAQLTISLASTLGTGTQSETSQSSFAITALDTSSTPPTTICGGNPT